MIKGFVVNTYHISGGCAGKWEPTLERVFEFLRSFGDDPNQHQSITIVPCFEKDVNRYVVNVAKDRNDSGISTPKEKKK